MELRTRLNEVGAILPSEMEDILRVVSDYIEKKVAESDSNPAYTVRFDPRWIECLRIMKKTGSPMTTNEIAEMMSGDRLYRKQVVRYFVYARHWKLIKKTGEKYKGSDLYVLTPECIACLDNDNLRVQSSIWTKKGMRVEPPHGESDGDYVRVLPQ